MKRHRTATGLVLDTVSFCDIKYNRGAYPLCVALDHSGEIEPLLHTGARRSMSVYEIP